MGTTDHRPLNRKEKRSNPWDYTLSEDQPSASPQSRPSSPGTHLPNRVTCIPLYFFREQQNDIGDPDSAVVVVLAQRWLQHARSALFDSVP